MIAASTKDNVLSHVRIGSRDNFWRKSVENVNGRDKLLTEHSSVDSTAALRLFQNLVSGGHTRLRADRRHFIAMSKAVKHEDNNGDGG